MIRERLEDVIRDTGLSQREFARTTGIDETVLSRFVRGERELRFRTIDQLLDALGLEIVIRPRGHSREDG
jgi:transcriptional regulator with XRE-family HTH domain